MVDDPRVSRRHLRLDVSEGRLTVTDLGSTNGTMVNGRPISGTTLIDLGDEVTLGETSSCPVGAHRPAGGSHPSRAGGPAARPLRRPRRPRRPPPTTPSPPPTPHHREPTRPHGPG